MSTDWEGQPDPPEIKIGPLGWILVALRAPLIAFVVFGGLLVLLGVRLVERPLFAMRRPVTPWITQTVCRVTLFLMGLPLDVQGPRMVGPGAIVANHSTWLDIFVLNSRKNIYFVSKEEVAGWPGIGWLARATGTVFIKRDRRQAKAQTQLFENRLLHGHRLLFFPEGTSTDNQRVLPFKTTLFAAFYSDRLREDLQVQAVSVVYHAPPGQVAHYYGWWGDMEFAPSLLQVLATVRQGRVSLIYHTPEPVRDYGSRKDLAAQLETQVRAGHQAAQIAALTSR